MGLNVPAVCSRVKRWDLLNFLIDFDRSCSTEVKTLAKSFWMLSLLPDSPTPHPEKISNKGREVHKHIHQRITWLILYDSQLRHG